MNDTEWGNGDIRLHHKWWFNHMPHAAGSITEYGMTRLNNWWAYLQDFNRYPESGGDHAPGGPPPPAGTWPFAPRAVTANANDDWSPQINANGRIVWHGSDGSDFEIYSARAGGGPVTQITDNSNSDEDPKINAAGRIVWQSFDGQDYEIFSANADGTGLVQITNNTVNDWHPAINDSGRIVWDSFDGEDYEIWSANADGTDKRQITNNTNGGVGYPREDVWPKINNNGRVVWFGHDGTNWEIYSANADGTNLVNVSNNLNTYENEYPEINDAGQVVWHAWVSDTNSEIYTAPATGGTVRRITNNTFEDWYPQINAAGTVVWMARSNGHWQIATAGASGGSVSYLTSSSTHNQYPRIASTGQVAWQGFDGSDWEIYTWKQGQIQKVSDNNYDDRAAVLNASGQIAWHAASAVVNGADSTEIFVSSPPGPDFDRDGDVDIDDLNHLRSCLTSEGVPQTDPKCKDADLDLDGDVDQNDYGVLQKCLNGPRVAPPAGC
jgi:Tol biopolymer transport system component